MKKLDYRISRWLFVRLSKKEPTLFDAYAAMMGSWVVAGVWFFAGIAIAILPFSEDIVWNTHNIIMWLLVIVFFICGSIFWGWNEFQENKKTGFNKVMKEFMVNRWYIRRKKYGLESADEQSEKKTEAP